MSPVVLPGCDLDRTDSDRRTILSGSVRHQPAGVLQAGVMPMHVRSETATTYSYLPSPLGPILLVGTDDALEGLYLVDHGSVPEPGRAWRLDDRALAGTRAELDEYFAGSRTTFEAPLRPDGTAFQREVWHALGEIPYGETVGYGELATAIGRPSASRAVGAANGSNPISIIIPCHRVIGANGTLTGYGWGVDQKAWLLTHEGARIHPRRPTRPVAGDPSAVQGSLL
jgi:methylated-DNA-[protein]-cysteine S-methyltransferase